jgi:SulP family sulfate permease
MLVPKLATCLRNYTWPQFAADFTAGVVVGIVALPLAMAFAIASGVQPELGLYTAIVAGFLISLLGGSRVQIGGPTGAFIVIVADIVHKHGIDGLWLCTVMAGFLLIGLGVARLGNVIKYIPYPVITGFTSGIAVIIFSLQIPDLFGLATGKLPGDFAGKWAAYFGSWHTVNVAAVALSVGCVLVIACWPKAWKRLPGTVVAMVLATVIASLFGLPVETIGSRFGSIPDRLPMPTIAPIWDSLSLARIQELMGPAVTVALLGAIESLLSAVVADGMTGYRHRSNIELVAQGVANVVSPLFGGLPATGAIARTATNIRNGATTPVAGLVHALTLLLIMWTLAPWAKLIPMCALASVLVVVAYNMSEWRAFRSLLRTPRGDVAVLLATFALTIIFDLTVAVQVGVVLSAFLFLQRMAGLTRVGSINRELLDPENDGDGDPDAEILAARRQVPTDVQVYEVNGPFFFGAAGKLRDVMGVVDRAPKVLVLRMRHVPFIDATGLHSLEELHKNAARAATALILCGIHHQPLLALRRSGLLEMVGRCNVTRTIDRALWRAKVILGLPIDPSEVPPRRAKRNGTKRGTAVVLLPPRNP